jgi:hypothetical protein
MRNKCPQKKRWTNCHKLVDMRTYVWYNIGIVKRREENLDSRKVQKVLFTTTSQGGLTCIISEASCVVNIRRRNV